jgi:hypothetical protein
MDERAAIVFVPGVWPDQHMIVTGETPKRYRVRAPGDDPVTISGGRTLAPGQTSLVPKYAVTFMERVSETGREPRPCAACGAAIDPIDYCHACSTKAQCPVHKSPYKPAYVRYCASDCAAMGRRKP